MVTETIDPTIVAAVVGGLAALVVAGIGGIITVLVSSRNLREQLKLENAAEQSVRLLFSRGWTLRSFDVVKSHLRGFEDNELRRLLIRSGAIAFETKSGTELWGLAEANSDLLADASTSPPDGDNTKRYVITDLRGNASSP